MDRRAEARAYSETAFGQMERMNFRPELALRRLDVAALLAEGSAAERAEARAHLGAAIPMASSSSP